MPDKRASHGFSLENRQSENKGVLKTLSCRISDFRNFLADFKIWMLSSIFRGIVYLSISLTNAIIIIAQQISRRECASSFVVSLQ
jgi:hypothetical protein